MGNSTPPGPLGTEANKPIIDDGTLALTLSPAPTVGNSLATPAPSSANLTDADIEVLDLVATAKAAAYALKKVHPSVKFTSGRRTKGK